MKQFSAAALFLLTSSFITLVAKAQDNPGVKAQSNIRLGQSTCKAVEGYYESVLNKNLYIQTVADDSLLVIKNLWAKDADTLQPTAGLVFTNRGQGQREGPKYVFARDSTGRVISLDNGWDTWNRVNEYKPKAVAVMPHTPSQLKRFEGVYHFQNDTTGLIQFIVEGNDLVLKDNGEIHLVPETPFSFYRKDNLWFTVDFNQDKAGHVTGAIIVKHQAFIKNPKPTITAAQLLSFQGEYQAKNDSDNVIQLIAKDRQLIVKQLWDSKEVVVTPLADLYFYNKAEKYSLQFVRDGDGVIRQAWLFNTTEFDKK